MSFQFYKPVGAVSDVKELEYISALHQTAFDKIRKDGSIYAKDISRFLCSRYGIKVNEARIRKTIIKGFGGGDEENECIDLTELVAILMIPLLLKSSKHFVEPLQAKSNDLLHESSLVIPPAGIINDVLVMILSDVTGSAKPKKLSKGLIKDILLAYGEKEMAEDSALVDEMFQAAIPQGSKGALFDLKTFTKALTQDIQDYEVMSETKITTYFYDVYQTYDAEDLNEDFSTEKGTTPEEKRKLDIESPSQAPRKQGIKLIYTAPALDDVVGSYSSKTIVTFLWSSFIITYFAYFYDAQYSQELSYCTSDNARNEFGCLVANGILNWLIVLAQLCVLGVIYMGLGSIGNSIEKYTSKILIISMISIFCFTYIPYHLTQTQEEVLINGTKIENNTVAKEVADSFNYFGTIGNEAAIHDQLLFYMAMILGCCTLIAQLRLLVTFIYKMPKGKIAEHIFTPGCVVAESKLKIAAQYKVNSMIKNAHDVHKLSSSHESCYVVSSSSKSRKKEKTSYGRALLDYDKLGKKTECVGGYLWTWKQIFNGEIFTREGIWFSARLHAGNLSQILISIFILVFGISFTNKIASNHNIVYNHGGESYFTLKAKSFTERYFSTDELIQSTLHSVNKVITETFTDGQNCSFYFTSRCSSFKNITECPYRDIISTCLFLKYGYEQHLNNSDSPINQAVEEAVVTSATEFMNQTMYTLYPEKQWMVTIPLSIATYVAFFVGLYLTLVYIPSVTTTILQYRSGVIPSLGNNKFHNVKNCQDKMTLLLGSMFWGTFFAGVAIGCIAGGIVFLFLWQVSRPICLHYLGQIIGLLVTITLRWLILRGLRRELYASLYRKFPAAANITSLILECINIGLSAGFVVVRAFKLILVAIIYVGRIDKPILATGVGKLWKLEPDAYSVVIRKDILAHEAHRHPYIELLGGMYLMKLRHGDRFAKTSGSCWRILFVFALMPWLRKYRVMARPTLLNNVTDEDDDATFLDDHFSSCGVSMKAVVDYEEMKQKCKLYKKKSIEKLEKKRSEGKSKVAVEI